MDYSRFIPKNCILYPEKDEPFEGDMKDLRNILCLRFRMPLPDISYFLLKEGERYFRDGNDSEKDFGYCCLVVANHLRPDVCWKPISSMRVSSVLPQCMFSVGFCMFFVHSYITNAFGYSLRTWDRIALNHRTANDFLQLWMKEISEVQWNSSYKITLARSDVPEDPPKPTRTPPNPIYLTPEITREVTVRSQERSCADYSPAFAATKSRGSPLHEHVEMVSSSPVPSTFSTPTEKTLIPRHFDHSYRILEEDKLYRLRYQRIYDDIGGNTEVSKWTSKDRIHIPYRLRDLGNLFMNWGIEVEGEEHKMHAFVMALCVFTWVELLVEHEKTPVELIEVCKTMGMIYPSPEACIPVVHELLTKCPEFRDTYGIDVNMIWYKYLQMIEEEKKQQEAFEHPTSEEDEHDGDGDWKERLEIEGKGKGKGKEEEEVDGVDEMEEMEEMEELEERKLENGDGDCDDDDDNDEGQPEERHHDRRMVTDGDSDGNVDDGVDHEGGRECVGIDSELEREFRDILVQFHGKVEESQWNETDMTILPSRLRRLGSIFVKCGNDMETRSEEQNIAYSYAYCCFRWFKDVDKSHPRIPPQLASICEHRFLIPPSVDTCKICAQMMMEGCETLVDALEMNPRDLWNEDRIARTISMEDDPKVKSEEKGDCFVDRREESEVKCHTMKKSKLIGEHTSGVVSGAEDVSVVKVKTEREFTEKSDIISSVSKVNGYFSDEDMDRSDRISGSDDIGGRMMKKRDGGMLEEKVVDSVKDVDGGNVMEKEEYERMDEEFQKIVSLVRSRGGSDLEELERNRCLSVKYLKRLAAFFCSMGKQCEETCEH
eukprot:TRINITY_DN1448_c0_g1_i13.p1 TRINITY_DN1448_c0_g1~~TRINITY_DN1448_c0_g1_i13.p1  ORF type:complete len:957 (-),score=284.13 TRINITY_DN1448_c0_g1_i13:1465-3945(-)